MEDQPELNELLSEVGLRVHEVLEEQARWPLLLEAVVTLAADLSLEELLERIVEIAGTLVGARYAALGVLGEGPDHRLASFITWGMSAAEVEAIGALPDGHGLLGLLIDRPEPLRTADIADHPDSYGLPTHHPPMRSFLGVPLRIRDKVFGNLYLTERRGGGGFTQTDEQIAVALAAAAGVAIENSTLHAEAARRERWLSAAAEITGALSDPVDPEGVGSLQLVVDRARDVSEADVAWIATGSTPAELRLRVVSGGPATPEAMAQLDLSDSLSSRVVTSGVPISVEDLAEDPRAINVPTLLGWPALGPAVVVPLCNEGQVEGVLALAWKADHADLFHRLDTALPVYFAEHAALALQVLSGLAARERLTLLEDRGRIARELHDVVIQRLFRVGLGLQATAQRRDPQVKAQLGVAIDELDAIIREVRRTVFALG